MKKNPMIQESIDESLSGIRFNAQDKRSVLRAVRNAQPQKKKRLNLRLDLVCAGLLLVVLIAPLSLAKMHTATVSTVTDSHLSNPSPDSTPLAVFTATPVATPAPTPVVTPSPTPSPTPTPTPSPTPVVTPSPTPTPVVTPSPTPVVTPAPTPVVSATPLFSLKPAESAEPSVNSIIQQTRDLYNELCDTTIFTFDEFTANATTSPDGICLVVLNNIYENGCSFSASFDMKTGELLSHSDPEQATTPSISADSSATAQAWFDKYGPNFADWPTEARSEYSRRYGNVFN